MIQKTLKKCTIKIQEDPFFKYSHYHSKNEATISNRAQSWRVFSLEILQLTVSLQSLQKS